MQSAMASAHFFSGRYAEALSWAQMALREKPGFLPPACVVAASGALAGRLEEAPKAMTRVRQLDAALRMSNLTEGNLFPIWRSEDFARWADGLRMAELPSQTVFRDCVFAIPELQFQS
jgi:hypothetical protein